MDRKKILFERKKFKDAVPNADSTILVAIPAYKDPELINTVYSAVMQADVPDRIHFAVCYQDDDLMVIEKLKAIKHMKIKHLWSEEAKGLCYARYLCQDMRDGEDFVFYIDSHMRFIKHWDTELLQQWFACNDDKAVISSYAPSLQNDWCGLKLDDPQFDLPATGTKLAISGFIDEKAWHVKFQPWYFTNNEKPDVIIRDRSPFISGHYTFGPASMNDTVRKDPNMFFVADELAYAILLYTYGYNVYNTEKMYAYHKYGRENERKEPPIGNKIDIESARIRTLMGISEEADLGEFGPGQVRTIDQYQEFAGIYFKDHIITDQAKSGVYGFKYIRKQDINNKKKQN